jgi:hypothetical protein
MTPEVLVEKFAAIVVDTGRWQIWSAIDSHPPHSSISYPRRVYEYVQ